MKKLSARKRCALIIGAVLLAIYLIVSVIFWFTGMPKIFFRYKVKEDNTISIDYYSGFFPLLRIPDKIDGLPVTEIDDMLNNYSYDNKSRTNNLANLTVAVHIPDSVEILRCFAFCGFSCLTYVNIPSSLRSTENHIFAGTKIRKLVFPEGITEIGVSYEENASKYWSFANMKQLRKVVFPESLKKIGKCAFENCPRLRKVTLPEGLEEIGNGAFRECGLTKINIPKNLKKTGGTTFYDTPFEKKLKKKADGDFIIFNGDIIYKYIGKDENVIIPDNIISICDQAFWKSKIKSVTIPEGVKNVDGAFENSGIEKIELPDTVEGNDLEFINCKYLKEIRLPENTTKIRYSAFKNCYSLENIVLPEGITEIGDNAFSKCSSLSEIKLPEWITKIGDEAFSNCSSLSEIKLPEGITEIGDEAFSNCSSFSEIKLPEGLTKIGSNAFEYCHNLKDIEIHEGVTEIESGAFSFCTSLERIVIPESVTYIGNGAFWNCTSLKEVVIKGDPVIEENAFNGCGMLENKP